MAIQNRYEFIYYVACSNCNPNGDPDMGNTPRIDPQTMQGYITDGATKRRIRNYVELAYRDKPGMGIIIQQATNINRHIAEAKRAAGVEDCAKAKEAVYAGRKKACELFYDVRAFGAVMSTGPNAGQVRGPVQITFGKSLDPVLPLDISITRMAVADKVKDGAVVEDYMAWEEAQPEDKLRTMGRKQIIPFEEVRRRLKLVGAPYEPEQLGVSRARFRDTFAKIPYMRSRFSNIDIAYRCGFMDEWLERLFGKGGIWEVE